MEIRSVGENRTEYPPIAVQLFRSIFCRGSRHTIF